MFHTASMKCSLVYCSWADDDMNQRRCQEPRHDTPKKLWLLTGFLQVFTLFFTNTKKPQAEEPGA